MQLNEFAIRYTAAWCSHEPQRVPEFLAEHGSLTINRGVPAVGRAAIATATQGFMTAFPDLVVVMDSLETAEPTVRYHWTLTGTNTGPGGTGRPVHISGYGEWTFGPDGRIAQSRGPESAPAYARQQRAVSALWNERLCAGRHDGPQLMRMSLGRSGTKRGILDGGPQAMPI